MWTASQGRKVKTPIDRNSATPRVVREMFDRVMTVAQLLHQHEQTLPSRVESDREDAEKTQDFDAVVS